MTAPFPCPVCRYTGKEQPVEPHQARVYLRPGSVGILCCPNHQPDSSYPARPEPDADHTVPFVLEQPNLEAVALSRVLAAWEEVEFSTCLEETVRQEDSLRTILRSVAREFGFTTSGYGGDK